MGMEIDTLRAIWRNMAFWYGYYSRANLELLQKIMGMILWAGLGFWPNSSIWHHHERKSVLIVHLRRVHLKHFQCDKGSKSFGRRGDLQKRRKTVHEGIKDFQCGQYSKSLGHQSALQTHIKHCTKEQRIFNVSNAQDPSDKEVICRNIGKQSMRESEIFNVTNARNHSGER